MRRILIIIGIVLVAIIVVVAIFSYSPTPQKITYGVTFSDLYARELGLPWQKVYTAILEDLKVTHLRLVAYWQEIQPNNSTDDFSVLDIEMNEAKKHGASVILAIGRRVPRWPECHEPDWAKKLSWDDEKVALLSYITKVVNRYKDYSNLTYWQVENEPFLTVFSTDACGNTVDTDFLKQEIALVKSLDPNHPVLVTDSGNLGLWHRPYQLGDAFGTSVYLYVSNNITGPMKSFYFPWMYRLKGNLVSLFFGHKPLFLIELSVEPWLDTTTIPNTPIEDQLKRMNMERFDEIMDYAEATHLNPQYLWGAEWWYWMKEQGRSEFWDKAHVLFKN